MPIPIFDPPTSAIDDNFSAVLVDIFHAIDNQ
jgi:hypothetical protein